MTRATYEHIGRRFDRLWVVYKPMDSEGQRQAFRAAWLQFLDKAGWTEDEWEEELGRQMDLARSQELNNGGETTVSIDISLQSR